MNIFSRLLATALLLLTLPAQAQTVFKIATIAPEGSGWMDEMRAGSAEIERRTDGRVKFKFYGGGVMGNDKKVMRKMRIGQLHGGAFVSSGLADRYPDIQLYGLPLLFETNAEAEHIRKEMDPVLKAGFEKAGLICLGIAAGGFAHIMAGEPVRGVTDLKGRKVWVPEGDLISYKTMEAFGLAPVTLPITDVLTGMQTGLVDIIGSSAVAALVLQWHTRIKYVTEFPISYLLGTLVVEEKEFRQIAAADQAVVREVMATVYKKLEAANLRDDVAALAALQKGGIQVVQPEAELAPQWRVQAREVRQRLAAEGSFSADKLVRIEALLAEFRESAKLAAAVNAKSP